MPISKKDGSPVSATKPTVTKPATTTKQPTKPWYVRGDATAQAVAKEDLRIEEKQAQRGKLYRFWLQKGDEAPLTFVDGNLTQKGILDCFMYREHDVPMAGKYGNTFVCTAEQEPCPICESGDEPALVAVFTVIDHREFTSKKGNTYANTRKLFVCKRNTLKLLQKEATKHEGLVGCRFDVSRIGDQAARVGDVYSFTEKGDPKVLAKQYTREEMDPKTKAKKTVTNFEVADYSEEIRYHTAAELRKLGFGKGTPIGGEGPVTGAKAASADVEEELG